MDKLYKTIIRNKEVLSREFKRGLKTATVLFHKKKVYKDSHGNITNEIPFEEILTVIGKKDQQIWLSCEDVANLKQLLDNSTLNAIESIASGVVA